MGRPDDAQHEVTLGELQQFVAQVGRARLAVVVVTALREARNLVGLQRRAGRQHEVVVADWWGTPVELEPLGLGVDVGHAVDPEIDCVVDEVVERATAVVGFALAERHVQPDRLIDVVGVVVDERDSDVTGVEFGFESVGEVVREDGAAGPAADDNDVFSHAFST